MKHWKKERIPPGAALLLIAGILAPVLYYRYQMVLVGEPVKGLFFAPLGRMLGDRAFRGELPFRLLEGLNLIGIALCFRRGGMRLAALSGFHGFFCTVAGFLALTDGHEGAMFRAQGFLMLCMGVALLLMSLPVLRKGWILRRLWFLPGLLYGLSYAALTVPFLSSRHLAPVLLLQGLLTLPYLGGLLLLGRRLTEPQTGAVKQEAERKGVVRFCRQCGAPVGERERFCRQCGTPISWTAETR